MQLEARFGSPATFAEAPCAPTLPNTVLLVLALVEAISSQRLLFSSLASSAFLIYLDPEHSVNQARTLLLAQLGALLGLQKLTLWLVLRSARRERSREAAQ